MGVETPMPPFRMNSAAPKGAPRRINAVQCLKYYRTIFLNTLRVCKT